MVVCVCTSGMGSQPTCGTRYAALCAALKVRGVEDLPFRQRRSWQGGPHGGLAKRIPQRVESNGLRLYCTAAHQYWKSYFLRSPYASSRKRLSSAGCTSAAPPRMSAHS